MSAVQVASKPAFADRLREFLGTVEYRRADSDEDKDAIYRLRYNAYLDEGAIVPNPTRRLSDRFDEMDNSWTFGLYIGGRLASSIRISHATPDNPEIPAVCYFPDILGKEVAAGKTIVDPNRFVADPAIRKLYPALPYLTARLGFVACEYFNADIGLATPRREHQAFYKRVFGLNLLAPPRPYPTLIKPLSLMGVRYLNVRDYIHRRYPSFRSSQAERMMLFSRLIGGPDGTTRLPLGGAGAGAALTHHP